MSSLRILWVLLFCLLAYWPSSSAGTCTGAEDCTACSSCKYCKHCAQMGGTCGVKEALEAKTGQAALSPTPQALRSLPAPTPSSTPTSGQLPQKTLQPFKADPTSKPGIPGQRQDYQVALVSLADPAKLATLGDRGANPRLKKIVYWLDYARKEGRDPGQVIDGMLRETAYPPAHAALIKTNLMRNIKIGDELGFFTPENAELLRRGAAPRVLTGPYAGDIAHVDHIIPFSIAPEIGNDLANLELMPSTLNLRKSAKIGERQKSLATGLKKAGVIDYKVLQRIQGAKITAPVEEL